MRRVLTTGAALALTSSAAVAGGVERSTQSVSFLFEQGNYLEFSMGWADPDVSGTVGGGTVPSGDMAPSYFTTSFAYKQALSDNLDIGVTLDQPIGARIDYPGTFGVDPYPLAGTQAKLSSAAITGYVKYRFPSNVSLIGGIRVEQVKGTVVIPLVGGYTLETNNDYAYGYVLGVAWEKPEIAARVALTYNSAISHDLESTEFGVVNGTFTTEIPQSLNLEFQTGIAADTLLFGSIRWVDWTAFNIDPVAYPLAQPLVRYQSDRITYNLGIGRRFSETWSGAVTIGYEPSNGDPTGNLGPVDGFSSIGLAATYTNGPMKITGGVRYIKIGDATTETVGGSFTDNDGIGVGIRVGYSF